MEAQIVMISDTELSHIEARIERTMRHAWFETGLDYQRIRDADLYKQNNWNTWADYCQQRWSRTQPHIDQQIARAREMQQIVEISTVSIDQLPASMSHATKLAKLESPEHRAMVWQRVLARQDGRGITAALVEEEVEKFKAALDKTWITLEEWSAGERWNGTPTKSAFNRTSDTSIEWAAWTWNPVTGCRHGCPYCYARDLAARYYPKDYGFEPTYHPGRLAEPMNTSPIPPRFEHDIGCRGVFVCSMADLFGQWVPDEWIRAVLDVTSATPDWTYIFLTKNPKRMIGIDWPDNAWVGTTVDVQARVRPAEYAFQQIKAHVKFLSCEPMRERLVFRSLDMFDWVIIGAQSRNSQMPAFQPPFESVWSLTNQAHDAECKVFWKPNLEARPREYPSTE